MKSKYSMTTRGAALAAPRRFFSLLLALIILFSFACPALAADSKIDISSDFWKSNSVGTCKSYPSAFDKNNKYESFRREYPVYFLQISSKTLERTKNGACYYNLEKLTQWKATAGAIKRDSSDTVYTTAVSNYNAAKSYITLSGITLSETADHLLFFVADAKLTNVAYLLVEWGEAEGSLTDEQKKPLTDLLATVADGNDKYVQSGDRYNGNGYNPSGFWAAFTAKDGPREQAQKELASATSPEDIEAARAKLQAAIDQLIPADRLNTTPLYEAIQRVSGLGYNDLSLKEYTETSAALFKAGRDDAQKYLDSLFTGEEGNRKPSDANKKENQTTFDAAVTKARELPTLLVHQSPVSYSEQNTKNIQALAARYGAGENPGYTEESWSALQSARTDALAYVKEHPVTDRLTRDENRGLREKAIALWNAICSLKPAAEQIRVTLTYTDDYHLRVPSSEQADKSGLTPGVTSYTLDSGTTLRQLLDQAGYKYPNGDWAADLYPGDRKSVV